MDSQPPSSAPTNPPASPAPESAPVATPAAPMPVPAPVDPYLPNWSEEEWAEQAQDVNMEVGELKALSSPAGHAVHDFGGSALQGH
jgi:hypothetical protein